MQLHDNDSLLHGQSTFFSRAPQQFMLFFSQQVLGAALLRVSFMKSLSDLIQVEILVKFHLTHVNSKLPI